jgi:hypothetical protein
MCDLCHPFGMVVAIKSNADLEKLHNRLISDGVKPGLVRVVNGSLQRNDIVDCTLQCSTCQQKFRLWCETYHGSGGQFGPVA